MEEIKELVKQVKSKPARDELGRLLPGNSGNLAGRPKGKTMKEFARDFLMNLSDEDKEKWLKKVSDETVWKMAEGMPKQDIDANVEVKSKIIKLDE